MKPSYSRIVSTIAGLMAVLGAPAPAFADDSEVFLSSAFTEGAGVRPNVLFILDTSYSMTSEVENVYDPTRTYEGSCDSNYIYWRSENTATPPNCTSTTQKISLAANRCRDMHVDMLSNGWWRGRVQQLNGSSSAWQDIVAGQQNRKVECYDDRDIHGDLAADVAGSGGSSGQNRARNGTSNSSRWGNSGSNNQVNWTNGMSRSFYSANYINYWNSTDAGNPKTRMEIVKEVATDLVQNLEGVNLGLMRYSDNGGLTDSNLSAEGGMVTYPVSELTATTRAQLIEQIEAMNPTGFTPLSETYYEAHQYLSGGAVDFGNNSRTHSGSGGSFKSVANSRVGNVITSNTYKSPMLYSCQKTFIVYLTDGLPTQDESASSKIMALPGFAEDGYVSVADGGGGSTCPESGPDGDTWSDPADGRCMVNLAGYMRNHDLRPTVPGAQNVTTYVVGFGSGIAASKTYLDQIAKAGGGRAYTQSDAAGLTAALEEILSDVAEDANTTFVSPTVAVNAFNRTRTLDSLYVSVFAPTNRVHWPGNVKKYRLLDGVIHGQSDLAPAVDEDTGFFDEGAKDLFNNTAEADGPDVTLGGAAARLPAWDARKVYTDVDTTAALTADNNKFRVANAGITNEKLGLAAEAATADRSDVIEFTLGKDVNNDVNPNGNDYTETRKAMGDPMRSRPAVAIYGGTEDAPTGTVFVTTNDGMLQALDMNTGAELWSFIPHDMMARLASLQENLVISNRSYGVDGDVRVFKYDVDDDGVIEAGDRMYVLFGFGRGGSTYYALDVTSQDTPKLLWKKSATELPMLGKAWSTPVITRVNVDSSSQTDPQKHVIIFGAGYDPSQDNYTYTTDGVGNGVYMLELKTGNLLWSAGITGSDSDWEHPFMNNSIPSDITVLDINGDGYSDRMYFGDMGGRIWRLDIWHGQAPGNLTSGGILASLGAGHLDSPTTANARRFYYAPDVALVTPRGSAPYFNIAIGSGYRGHPLDTDIQDRFYSIRDYQPFNKRTNTSFNAGNWSPIEDSDLIDVTTNVNTLVPDGSNGWKIRLAEGGTTWRGEKVLGESVTANGVIFFPTFTPTGADPDNPCLPATLNRTWAVYIDSARPYGLRDTEEGDDDDDSDTDDPSDRYEDSRMGGIAPPTSIVQDDGKTICLKGVATHKCVDIGDITRTFWERRQ